MIKFFRRIRQKLLSENKFSKYLLYAIGEIVLVVLGILIALQINDWNERQKILQKEQNYLALIRQEMVGNLHSIQKEKRELDAFLESLTQIMSLQTRRNPSIANKKLSQILVPILSQDVDFNFKDGTLKEIIATGNLKDITNDGIRNILASISGNLERVRAQEEEVNDYIFKGNHFIEKTGSIIQVINDVGLNTEFGIPKPPQETDNLFLLQSGEFENIMVYASLTGVTLKKDYYSTFEEEIKTLIDLIDKELGNSSIQ